jgi:CheY-like chemotaxis protein
VLLVDDHPMNRELGEAMLVLAGCVVTVAEDGDEAVRLAAQRDFDVILMDVHMPRMDGLAATRAIRAREAATGRRRTPIIALTANAMTHQALEYQAAGMDGLAAKPIDIEKLFAAIQQAMAAPGSGWPEPRAAAS